MPKEEWGVKRLCPSCATRFYDLGRDPMTCPSCGTVFDRESLTSKKAPGRPEKKPQEAPAASLLDDDDVVLDDDDADVDIEDELLDEDDEDGDVSLDDIADVGGDDED